MTLTGSRTYVGFGFGAIQAGLFLDEAFRSGAFRRLVVVEVVPEVVDALRLSGGQYALNVAHDDHLELAEVGPIEIRNPAVDVDREAIVEAIAAAAEIGTAVPSVRLYATDGESSLHRLLAAGIRRKIVARGPRAVVYTAENHNDAAGILEARVREALPQSDREAAAAQVRFLDTVIGKMSGVIEDAGEIEEFGLRTVTPDDDRAFLVEAFNRILISRADFEGPFERGIAVFETRNDLLPFEEAKLYGHNATHALAAYVAAQRGLERIADLGDVPGALPFLRAAFIEESGGALVQKHYDLDSLFTWEGYRQYAGDLLGRMMNPFLRDTVERVGRDPARKLGWDDRLIGTMRRALDRGIPPRRFAFGAAAAVAMLRPEVLERAELETTVLEATESFGAGIAAVLDSVWGHPAGLASSSSSRAAVVALVEDGLRRLHRWRNSGFGDLELLFHRDVY